MKTLKRFMVNNKIKLLTIISLVLLLSTIMLIPKNITQKTITGYLSVASALGTADYALDGTDDNVQFKTALDALPATGGVLQVVSTATINWHDGVTVTRAIPNVTIIGTGAGTYFDGDGVTAIFTAGGNNWSFENFRTDAGGLAYGATTGYSIKNVMVGTTYLQDRTGNGTYTSASGTPDYVVGVNTSTDDVPGSTGYWVKSGSTGQVLRSTASPSDDDIQWAVDQVASSSIGGRILLSAGRFYESNPINFASATGKSVVIEGQGKLVTIMNQTANITSFFYSSVVHNAIQIKNIYIEGDKVTYPATIGIDGTNCQNLNCWGVQVWTVGSHGFKNVSWVEYCSAMENGGSGFYNDTWGLNATFVESAKNVQYGYRLCTDSELDSFDSAENGIGIYLPDGQFPILVSNGEITMTATVPSTVGIQLAGGNPSYILSNINIDVGIDGASGIKTTANSVGCQLSNINIRGRTGGGYGNQILFDFTNAFTRSVLNGFTASQTDGIGLKLDLGWESLASKSYFVNGEIYSCATPINVATGTVGITYELRNIHTNDDVNEKFTENSGTATILNTATSVVVTHGLAITPDVNKIKIIGKENPTNDVGTIWVDTITATQFTIHVENDPGASNFDVGWSYQE